MDAPAPMLAHVYDPAKPMTFPVMVQPKLDGVRCLTYLEEDSLTCMSRNGKPLHIPPAIHALPEDVLGLLAEGLVLDGELYIPGENFQTVVSVVKRENHPDAARLEYHIYDCFSTRDVAVPFDVRQNYLFGGAFATSPPTIRIVSAVICSSKTDIDNAHARWVNEGYEGSIIRNPVGMYKHSRSFDLLKRKDFIDHEYRVSDIVEGKGKNAGTAILICETSNYKTFQVTAPGTYDDKADVWNNKLAYIGARVTVRYQELSTNGIPRFPVAVGFPIDR